MPLYISFSLRRWRMASIDYLCAIGCALFVTDSRQRKGGRILTIGSADYLH